MEDFADDDFGELYADLKVLATPSPEEEEEEHDDDDDDDDDDDGADAKSNDADDDYIGTDSDDDGLNIVLNDEDPRGVSVGRDEDVHGDGLGKHGECVDQSKGGSELVSSDAHGCRSKNAVKGGYGSQLFRPKFMRTQGSMFVNNMKAGVQNQRSSSSYFDGTCDATNAMVVRHGSFLPWHWNIYDVNIDKLEEKPWRIPGVDITDYFNFGFNENTWKEYCMSLGQLWQTSVQIGIPVNESANLNQESTREQVDQVAPGSLLSPSSKCGVPKGRAIQVENSVVERQPSIHVRRPRSIDSDVIIQIKVHESSDKNSGSDNSNVHDLWEEGEFMSGNNRNNDNSSGEHNVLSEEQSEDVKNSKESSGQERNDLIPDVVKTQHPDEEDQHSEDAEVLEDEINTEERVGVDTCSADPCWIEPELSLGDQDLSLTSYTDNDSEGTEDSVHVDNKNNHYPLRSNLVNSDTNLKESLSLYCKTSKNIGFNRKPVNIACYSRNRGPVQQKWRHQSGRHISGSKLKRHIENDNNVSHIPKSSGRDLSLWGHQFVNYRPKERLQYFGIHKRKVVSYNRETKQSCYYGAEKVVGDLVQTVYNEYSDREDGGSFRENANRYIRKNGDKKECFFEQRTLMEYNEDSDWHPASRKHYIDDDPSLLSYRESRQFLPKHSSFPAKERETQRRRMHHNPHFKDRNCNNDPRSDECEFEFLNRSYRMPSSFAEREMESLNNKHEEQFPQIDRELKRYAGRGRHHNRLPLVLDTLWSGKPEDECLKYTYNQASYLKYQRQSYTDSARNCVYGTRVNENFRGHERHKHATNKGNDWRCDYTDAAEDFITSPVKESEFYPLPSEDPHWTNDDNIVWNNDELHPEDDTFFYEEIPRHERHVRNGSLHAKVRIDDIKLRQHQLNLPRRDSDSFLERNSKVMSRDHCQQAVVRCRKSVDLINREVKSHAKSSRVVCNDRLENVDRGIAKKRVGFDDSHKKANKFDISKFVCDNSNQKSLQNLPDKGQKQGLDIEEGEIVTEEPYMEASVSRRDVSEGAALTDSVKKRVSQNGNNSELHIGNFDSQKILDSLAKMEKRRERFKQPIGMMMKETEKNLKLNTDSAVDIGEIKQQRPARKRRWNCA